MLDHPFHLVSSHETVQPRQCGFPAEGFHYLLCPLVQPATASDKQDPKLIAPFTDLSPGQVSGRVEKCGG